ncbi:hypothetical protein Tco_0373093, partial [Tanacetum coccineum]
TGFNQSGLVLIFRRWAALISFDFERCISSGIGLSSTGCSDGEAGFCLEELKGASRVSESSLEEVEEVEEDLNHHGASCDMYPMLHEVPYCCHIA